ncbi:formimidoylglutamate deiminase [Phenylobacterium hankyongense]|uniref:Formimidoylglutamate deiminase n=1 Tax=Phenylobacterium hankyongense TaxID=1813876 RepID=A0A328B4I3_9CAUL|nr:formimidoylglutamate deiminase [Phenylobacterium hankyongense]RAK61779.1 formimidoylglutamate deiminase [Phenylobacterium hankyongense]
MTRLWFRAALLPDGWSERVRLVTEGAEIRSVQTGVAPEAGDEIQGFGLPGLPNLHSHAFQRAMAGRSERRGGERDNFWSWRTQMYALAQAITPADLEAIAALAYAEMLESGFLRVGEFHYVHHDRDGTPFADPAEMAASLVAAAATTGIGLTLLPVYYAHAGFGGLAPSPAQRRFIHDPDSYARLLEASERALTGLEDARLGIAPHSLRAVTPDALTRLAQLRPDGPIHIHVAEQTGEVEDCLTWSGLRPVAWLMQNQPVDARWCLVHATHAEPGELAAIAASGAVVGLCPITEANLGDGVFPAAEFVALNGRFGIGSDSNVLIDAAQELRLLEYGQRLVRRERNVLSSADQIYAAACAGGAQALAAPADALSPGAAANLISLDADDPSLLRSTPDEILGRWVFAARRPVVDGVWRRGRKVVSGGRHHARDAIVARYRDVLERLRA